MAYGSDEVEVMTSAAVTWEQEDISYCLFTFEEVYDCGGAAFHGKRGGRAGIEILCLERHGTEGDPDVEEVF